METLAVMVVLLIMFVTIFGIIEVLSARRIRRILDVRFNSPLELRSFLTEQIAKLESLRNQQDLENEALTAQSELVFSTLESRNENRMLDEVIESERLLLTREIERRNETQSRLKHMASYHRLTKKLKNRGSQ